MSTRSASWSVIRGTESAVAERAPLTVQRRPAAPAAARLFHRSAIVSRRRNSHICMERSSHQGHEFASATTASAPRRRLGDCPTHFQIVRSRLRRPIMA